MNRCRPAGPRHRRVGQATSGAACCVLLSGALIGCGQTGPLYLPTDEPAEEQVDGRAEPAGDTPGGGEPVDGEPAPEEDVERRGRSGTDDAEALR